MVWLGGSQIIQWEVDEHNTSQLMKPFPCCTLAIYTQGVSLCDQY